MCVRAYVRSCSVYACMSVCMLVTQHNQMGMTKSLTIESIAFIVSLQLPADVCD